MKTLKLNCDNYISNNIPDMIEELSADPQVLIHAITLAQKWKCSVMTAIENIAVHFVQVNTDFYLNN